MAQMCMKDKTIMSKTTEEITKRLQEVVTQKAHLRFGHASNQLRSTHELRNIRREHARLLTALNARSQDQAK